MNNDPYLDFYIECHKLLRKEDRFVYKFSSKYEATIERAKADQCTVNPGNRYTYADISELSLFDRRWIFAGIGAHVHGL